MGDAATLKRKWVDILFDFVEPACEESLCQLDFSGIVIDIITKTIN